MKIFNCIFIPLLSLLMFQSCVEPVVKPEEKPEPDNPVTTKLATPEVLLTEVGDDAVDIVWEEVDNAAGYVWTLDGKSQNTVSETKVELRNLEEGEHTFTVFAAASGENFEDSDLAVVSFTIKHIEVNSESMKFIIDNFTHDMVRVVFVPSMTADFTVAVIPAEEATSDDAVIAAVNALPDDKKTIGTFDIVTWYPCHPHQKTFYTEMEFTNLSPETEYAVVAIAGDDNTVSSRKFRTEQMMSQSQTGTVFPRGVSLTGGFIDVDKIGKNAPYCNQKDCGDTPLCWACVAAGMIQYWLNDYAVSTGKEYTLNHPLPQTDYYSTQVMDVISQGMYHDASTPGLAIRWFFQGFTHPESLYMNGHEAFNADYEYYNGGWGSFDETTEEFLSIYSMREVSGFDMFTGKTKEAAEEVFGDKMLGWLRNGPVYFNISSGHHALCAWGAEFIVNANGRKIITKLYITENDPIGQKNALETAVVEFAKSGGTVFFPHISYSSNSKADVGIYMPIRTWEALNGK